GAGFDENDREYGVMLDASGTHAYETYPNWRVDAETGTALFPVAGVRDEARKETVYEMAFPWTQLRRTPGPGMVLGLNVIANENEGSERICWIGITPGIGDGKRPGVYRDFYLVE
ncbi:MAG: hypothetical protein JW951_03780, partial [Lentisphaerae bacterium]|nr:hypothetical protein [Lentisphaerota bacterium]